MGYKSDGRQVGEREVNAFTPYLSERLKAHVHLSTDLRDGEIRLPVRRFDGRWGVTPLPRRLP